MKKLIVFLLSLLQITWVFAQPSDAQVKSDATGQSGAGVKSVKLTKSTGTRQWNSSVGNWEYVRGAEVVRKSEYSGIDLIVTGDVVYQYTGVGKYSYWKFRVLDNQYAGIPNPSAKEIQDFISSDWEKFYGYYFQVITKVHQQPVLADKPTWFWHSPNQVSFKMKLSFDHIIRLKGIETLDCIWDVRFYRDDMKAPWKSMLALRSEEAADIKVLGFKNYTPEQLADFEKQTLQYTMAEQKARQSAATLPQMNVPLFTNAEEMVKYVHDVLRNGNPEKLRAVCLQLFAPGFFEEGSKVQLRVVEEQNFAQVITAVYRNKATYKQMYCQNPGYRVEQWGNGSGKKIIYITGAVNNCNSSFTIAPVNMGYKEGIAQTALKIVEYGVHVRQDEAAIDFINSFSNRNNLCKQD
jgi:hypothetical protein